jgi:ribosome biogenesis protein BMS1
MPGILAQKQRKRNQRIKKRITQKYKMINEAFASYSGRNAEKYARRNQDLLQKRLHVPQVDRTQLVPPPMTIAVVGPKGVKYLY